jgi:tetratricopeptide (TPR) repeat protein
VIHLLLLSAFLWQSPSFIEQSISSAHEEIAKEPNQPEGYNDLAAALVRKWRQTGDQSFVEQAEAAVAKSLKVDAANFGARRARVSVRLAQRRYQDALEEAEALRKQRPDDNPVYAFIAEAEIALGNYSEAEKAVQRMLDLRSVNAPGFESGAAVREMIGYPDGALEWWRSAINLVSDRDKEERAYIYSQMARIYRETGKYEAGVDCAQQSLKLEQDYPPALFELARIRIEQKRNDAAISLLRTRLSKGPDLASLYWLSVAQQQSGNMPEATMGFADFERQARVAAGSSFNTDALLIKYLTDHGKTPDAIGIAETALRRHQDLFTRESYALALARAGRPSEALEQIRKAIEPGFLDVNLYFDAGMIAKQQKDADAAAIYFKKAFELGSAGFYSSEILKQLSLTTNSAGN